MRRLLFGGQVVEWLSTEQPQVRNQRVDTVGRNQDGALHQVEFQSDNESGLPVRILQYYAFFQGTYGEHVEQTVLYLGKEPLRMADVFQSPSTVHRYTIVNLREFDAEPLLASDDWADNALALLAKGSPDKALEAVIPRLRAMGREDQDWATGTLILLSGILGIEDSVHQRLEEVGMINVMENKVLGPVIQRRYEQGIEQGREEGRQNMLQDQLSEKFGALPTWAMHRLTGASPEELRTWGKRVLKASTLEDTLA